MFTQDGYVPLWPKRCRKYTRHMKTAAVLLMNMPPRLPQIFPQLVGSLIERYGLLLCLQNKTNIVKTRVEEAFERTRGFINFCESSLLMIVSFCLTHVYDCLLHKGGKYKTRYHGLYKHKYLGFRRILEPLSWGGRTFSLVWRTNRFTRQRISFSPFVIFRRRASEMRIALNVCQNWHIANNRKVDKGCMKRKQENQVFHQLFFLIKSLLILKTKATIKGRLRLVMKY